MEFQTTGVFRSMFQIVFQSQWILGCDVNPRAFETGVGIIITFYYNYFASFNSCVGGTFHRHRTEPSQFLLCHRFFIYYFFRGLPLRNKHLL